MADAMRLGWNWVRSGLAWAAMLGASAPAMARAELDEYVRKPDSAFAWAELGRHTTEAGQFTELKLTSQKWKEITWEHSLVVYEPEGIPRSSASADSMLLFITGGRTGGKPSPGDHATMFAMARACGARVALLQAVPNQPLLGDRSEDDLISETFVRYLQSGDEEWPLLFPMVKSAVRAMDALQEWSRRGDRHVKRFVVTGASKRGWTTWLTGAVDDRVVAIAPMVIVMLNLGAQGPNQLKVWGHYSEQIHNYVERGLMEKSTTPAGTKLWKMVDPYTYRDRLARKPKLLINGTNDRYWTLDALDLYWNGLPGPKYLVELPNAGHGLDQNRKWAVNTLGAFYRHATTGRALPEVSWKFEADRAGASEVILSASPKPKAARLWKARSKSRDYREAKWESSPFETHPVSTDPPQSDPAGTSKDIMRIPKPAEGHEVYLVELEYEVDGLTYHLTTTFFEAGITPPTPPDPAAARRAQ